MHFFQPRYAMALITAFSIDMFQFLIALVLWAAFAVPGVAGAMIGCVAATSVVSNSQTACSIGAALGGFLHVAADFFSGGAVQGILLVIGGGLGTVVDFSISVTFGTGLFFLLWFMGMVPAGKVIFSWRRMPFMLGKLLPGINVIPLYTGMVIFTIFENEAKNAKGLAGKAVGVAAAAATGDELGAAEAAAGIAGAATAAVAGREASNENGPQAGRTPARGRAPLVDEVRRVGATQNRPAAASISTNQPARAANDNSLQVGAAANENAPASDSSIQRNSRSLEMIRSPLEFNPLNRKAA